MVNGRAACLLAVSAALAGCGNRSAAKREIEECRALGEGDLRAPGLEVHTRSRIERDGTLHPGEVPSCAVDAKATAAFLGAHEALNAAPAKLRPKEVVVHVAPSLPRDAPPLTAIEVHRPSRSVLLASNPGVRIERSMWLHEMAHLLMLGEQPSSLAARNLHSAVEEGIADYYAACVQGSPELGATGHGESGRDLRAPPGGGSSGWEALALDRRFDAHRFGWELAARLWATQPRVGHLLEDLLQCVAGARFGAGPTGLRQVMAALLEACPARSRDQVDAVLSKWLPPALHPER